ncbi:MAG: nitroreductase family deazaflavin-dependent oxidoreductase [bacterium]
MAKPGSDLLTMPSFVRWFSRFHVWLYRRSGGKTLGKIREAPILLLTTTGRKSGQQRTTPLIFLRDGASLAVVASNGGSDLAPAWWLNLQASSEAEVQIGGERLRVRARAATAEEQARLWPLLNGIYPDYESYQRKTTRPIPVVLLSPIA